MSNHKQAEQLAGVTLALMDRQPDESRLAPFAGAAKRAVHVAEHRNDDNVFADWSEMTPGERRWAWRLVKAIVTDNGIIQLVAEHADISTISRSRSHLCI